MSDAWLQYVPKDPNFRPGSAAAEGAQLLLSSLLPDAESVESKFEEKVTFFYPGANWAGVQCPHCGADAEPWWYEAMGRVSETEFKDLQCVAPCCGVNVSLNGLKYLWPAAFGSYVNKSPQPQLKGPVAKPAGAAPSCSRL